MTTPTPQIQSEAERIAREIYARLIPENSPIPCPISDILATALMEARQAALEEAAQLQETCILQYNSHGDQRTIVPLNGRPLCETNKAWASAIRDLAAKPPAQGGRQ